MRLIDADAAIDVLNILSDKMDRYGKVITKQTIMILEDIPTEYCETIRHGKWVDDCTCSVCHWSNEDPNGFLLITDYAYCPSCGAKMSKEEK